MERKEWWYTILIITIMTFPLFFKEGGPRSGGRFILSHATMFLRYKSHLKNYAQQNRKIPTESEWLVWNCFLKWDKQWYRFLRQKPVGWYILDFYCPKLKLCIEIDGESHEWSWTYDEKRDTYLSSLWIKTVRYKDIRVHKKLESIWLDIEWVIYERAKELKRNPPSA